MRRVYLFLLVSVCVVSAAFAGIPDDKDLLMWIGEGSGKTAVDGTGNGNDGTFHGECQMGCRRRQISSRNLPHRGQETLHGSPQCYR